MSTERPSYNFRYTIDDSKIKRELRWVPKDTFENGISETGMISD